MVRYGDFSLPIGHEVIKKDIRYCDVKTKKERRKSSVSKNELFRDIIVQAVKNNVAFSHVLADNRYGSTGVLYLISNDIQSNAERLYEVYQKRWRIEEFHKSVKQNASLAKSPTKIVKTQCNHIFSSMIAYCKLEMLKIYSNNWT